jgi:hypothetical protein
VYPTERAIAPKLTEFENYLQQVLSEADAPAEIPGVVAAGVGA